MGNIYASTLLNIAINELGTTEKPANSNKVKYNTWYYGKAVSGSAYPWCCVFVSWCYSQAGGISLIGGKKAYCPDLENYFIQQKQWYKNTEGKKGDICLMDFGKGRASHVGIVEKKNSDGTYTVIEGNTSSSSNDNGGNVMRRTRTKSVIRGFGRPKYDTEPQITIGIKCRLYKKATIKNGFYGSLAVGTKIEFIKDAGYGWSQVKSTINGSSYTGYVKNTCINGKSGLSKYRTGVINVASAPVRKKNKKTSKKIDSCKKGTKVTVISVGKYWTNVKYKKSGTKVNGFIFTKKLTI